MPAEEARNLGIFNRVPDDELEDAVAEFADELATKTPLSLELTKRTVLVTREGDVEDASAHYYELPRAFEAPETKAEAARFVDRRST